MDIFTLRPLIFAIFEYGLLAYVLYKGKIVVLPSVLILFFLATYQLGEFVMFSYDEQLGIRLALTATTMLPPLGILGLQRLHARRYGFPVFLIVALFFAAQYALQPGIITLGQECYCFAKYLPSEAWSEFYRIWGVYYLGTLAISIAIIIHNIYFVGSVAKRVNLIILLAYLVLIPGSLLIVWSVNAEFYWVPSVMCALGAITALCVAYTSVKGAKLQAPKSRKSKK